MDRVYLFSALLKSSSFSASIVIIFIFCIIVIIFIFRTNSWTKIADFHIPVWFSHFPSSVLGCFGFFLEKVCKCLSKF